MSQAPPRHWFLAQEAAGATSTNLTLGNVIVLCRVFRATAVRPAASLYRRGSGLRYMVRKRRDH